MKSSQISYKFKNEKNYESIKFVGASITLRDLKNKLKEKLQQVKSGVKDKSQDRDDLLIYDEQTMKLISDDTFQIQSDKKVVIERVSTQPSYSQYPTSYNPSYYRPQNMHHPPNQMPPHQNPHQNRMNPYAPMQTQSHFDPKQTQFKEIEKYFIDAKYFVIKSANAINIEKSISEGVWATTKSNEAKLNTAFQTSKNVILFFSINKSSQFQGYARMESPSSNKQLTWVDQDAIRLGGAFKVNWLRTCPVNFARISQFKNRFNNNEPLKKSRDTQEIPPEIGYEICKMFETPDRDMLVPDFRAKNYPYSFGQVTPADNDSGTASSPEDEATISENTRNEEILQRFSEQMPEEKPLPPKPQKMSLLDDIDLGFLNDPVPVVVHTPQNIQQIQPIQPIQPVQPVQIPQQSQSLIPDQILEEEKKASSEPSVIEHIPTPKGSTKTDEQQEIEEAKTPAESEKQYQNNPPPQLSEPPSLPYGMNPAQNNPNRPPPPNVNPAGRMPYPQMYPSYPGGQPGYHQGYPHQMMPPGGQMNPYYGYGFPGYGYQQQQQMWPGQQQPGYMGQGPPGKDKVEDHSDDDSDDSRRRKKHKKKKKRSRSRSRTKSKDRSHRHK